MFTFSPSYADVFRGGESFCNGIEEAAVDLFQRGNLFLFDAIQKISFQEPLCAAGAAFTREAQPTIAQRLLHSDLKEEFEGSLRLAGECGISISDRPSSVMVEHMYPDLDRLATFAERLLDTTPQEICERRIV